VLRGSVHRRTFDLRQDVVAVVYGFGESRGLLMRKLIVSNFVTLDGYYESEDKTFHRFFEYFYEGYGHKGI